MRKGAHMSALTLTSGEYPTLTRTVNERRSRQATGHRSAWLSTAAFMSVGMATLLVGVVLTVVYAFVAHFTGASQGAKVLLSIATTVAYVLGGITLIAGWHHRAVANSTARALGTVRGDFDVVVHSLAQQRAALDLVNTLPETMNATMRRTAQAHLDELQTLREGVEAEVASGAAAAIDAVGEIRTLMEQHATAEAILRRASMDNVVPLSQPNGQR
jgi:hypothetical protein